VKSIRNDEHEENAEVQQMKSMRSDEQRRV
jgi:hypothetical protein